MRKHPHYGTANDNSFIGDIVRFIDQHAHLKPFEKDLLVNRITERYTGDSVEVKIAHLAMGIALPEMFATKFADELDAIPLGTAQEERQRAKLWMEDAGRYARNEAYWREKRAYPAEECVRMLGRLLGFCGDFPGQLSGSPLLTLHDHVVSWGRPENPEQYHEVPTESGKIDDLKWLDNVVPRTANVSKPFAEQRFSVVQEFPGDSDPSRPVAAFSELPIDPEKIKPAQVKAIRDSAAGIHESGYFKVIVEREGGERCLVAYTEGYSLTLAEDGLSRIIFDPYKVEPPTVEEQARTHAKGLAVSIDLDRIPLGTAEEERAHWKPMMGWRVIVKQAQQLIQSWLDKQGHDRCWYYSDIFRELADLFGLKPTVDPQLPSVEAFQGGCQRYQAEQYGRVAAPTVVTDADVQTLIVAYKSLTVRTNSELWPKITALIDKMEAAIAENAKVGKPEGVLVSRGRLDQLEHAEDNLRVLKEHETHSRSMSFAELLDVHQRGAASLQHIGYLFLAAMREDKCFTIKMGPTVEITGSTSTDERPINAFGYTDPRETEKPKRRVIIQGEGRIFNHFETDEVQTIDEGFGNYSLRFKVAGVSQLKIVQGANGDYFVQHKSGLWRIEANGTIGSGKVAAAGFREVLKELGTPKMTQPSENQTSMVLFGEAKPTPIKVGDKVSWTDGGAIKRSGTVIKDFPAKTSLAELPPTAWTFTDDLMNGVNRLGEYSHHDRFVVEMTVYAAPRADMLTVVPSDLGTDE